MQRAGWCGIAMALLSLSYSQTSQAERFYGPDEITQSHACERWGATPRELLGHERNWQRLFALTSLAHFVYSEPETGIRHNASIGDEPSDWVVVLTTRDLPYGLYDPGGYAAAVRNVRTGEVVIAVRGSDNNSDWNRNFAEGGLIGDQHNKLAALVEKVRARFGTSFTTVLGHSRGGQLATYAAIVGQAHAVTFNSAVLPRQFFEQARRRYSLKSIELRHVYTATTDGLVSITDPVSSFSSLVTDGLVVGTVQKLYYSNELSHVTSDDMKGDQISMWDKGCYGGWYNPLPQPQFYCPIPGGFKAWDPTLFLKLLHSIEFTKEAVYRINSYFRAARRHVSRC